MDTKKVSELAERHRVEFERRADAREEEAAARARTEAFAIHLNRQTGRVNAHLGSEPLNLHMRVAAGELKVVWVFEGADPAEPADIALALGKKLADLSAGLVSDEPDS